MKKRIVSISLLLALLLAALPVQALAASPVIPIYVGNSMVDYLAEELLKEIPTAGKAPKEQILAVYDWIIANCSRFQGTGEIYFDESETAVKSAQFSRTTEQKLQKGQILLRRELKAESGCLQLESDYLDFDSNQYIASYAYEMMRTRTGNCAHFSALLTVLLGHLGYDCRVFHGEFINMDGSSVEHTWNYILLDGQYLWADIRIDQAVGGHNYFLQADTSAWAKEHTWEPAYSDWLATQAATLQDDFDRAAQNAVGPWDMCSDWAKDYMQRAGEANLIPKTLDDQDLTLEISRSEFAAVAVRLYEALKKQEVPLYTGANPFSDTDNPDVLRAYSLGIVNGMGDGTFAPDSSLTREQAVTMLGRVYELSQISAVNGGETLPRSTALFLDHSSIFDYAKNYVYFFAGQAIVEGMGDGTFSPKLPMTREQAIKIAVETADKLG